MKPLHSLTLGQLKEMIDDAITDYGDDMEIMVGYNAGDYWKTPLAATIEQDIEPAFVEYSSYHQTNKRHHPLSDEDTDEDIEEERARRVLLLNLNTSY